MHDRLDVAAAFLDRRLPLATREVLAYVVAHTNGQPTVTLNLADIAQALQIEIRSLQRHRTALDRTGWMTSTRNGDTITCTVLPPDDRAVAARSAAPIAQLLRDESPDRAATARTEDPDRAATARTEPPIAQLLRDEPPNRAVAARNEPCNQVTDPADPTHMSVCLSDKQTKQQTNKQCARTHAQERSHALLLAVGISPSAADAIARYHRHDYVVSQVFTWRHELAAKKVRGTGALMKRFRENFGSDPLTDADRASDLYRQYVETEAEQIHDRYATATAAVDVGDESARTVAPVIQEAANPAAELWAQLIAAFASAPQIRDHLSATAGETLVDDSLAVRCVSPGQAAALTDPRVARRILPELARLAGRPLTVTYEVRA